MPKTKIAAPVSATAAATPKESEKSPVRSTSHPVTAGPTTPEKLPTPFCIAVHFPAACGPARVCVMAQTLEANIP